MSRETKLSLYVVLAGGLLAALAVWATMYRYTPYLPMIRKPTGEIEPFTAPYSDKHRDAVIEVLVRYRESYRLNNGVLEIRQWLANDHDLLANYTSKAVANHELDSK